MFIVDGQSIMNENQNIGAEIPENDAIICEAILMDNLTQEELTALAESKTDCNILMNEQILQERNIVKLDKYAKKDRAFTQSVLAIAREKNDRDFKKLITVWKMKKYLVAKLKKKYKTQAEQRVRANMRKMSASKSPVAKKVADKVSKESK